MALKSVFEKEVCGRCCGSGRYSYNQMHGSVCYGCAGAGERLTKRGAVAHAAYIESCCVAVEDVVVGDVIRWSSVTHGGDPYAFKAKVESIEPGVQRYKSGEACRDDNAPWQEAPVVMFGCVRKSGPYGSQFFVGKGQKIRKYWPAEINDAKVAAALELQAGLSKSGKPLKQRKAA